MEITVTKKTQGRNFRIGDGVVDNRSNNVYLLVEHGFDTKMLCLESNNSDEPGEVYYFSGYERDYDIISGSVKINFNKV